MYRDWQEYKDNKLAAKQADKMFAELIRLTKENAGEIKLQKFYDKMHNTHLYKKHGALYCQVLADANR